MYSATTEAFWHALKERIFIRRGSKSSPRSTKSPPLMTSSILSLQVIGRRACQNSSPSPPTRPIELQEPGSSRPTWRGPRLWSNHCKCNKWQMTLTNRCRSPRPSSWTETGTRSTAFVGKLLLTRRTHFEPGYTESSKSSPWHWWNAGRWSPSWRTPCRKPMKKSYFKVMLRLPLPRNRWRRLRVWLTTTSHFAPWRLHGPGLETGRPGTSTTKRFSWWTWARLWATLIVLWQIVPPTGVTA